MSTVTLNDQYLTDIADSIRSKLNVATTYLPSEMAAAIDSIPTGGGGADYPDWSWVKNDGYDHLVVEIDDPRLYTITVGLRSFTGGLDWGDGYTQSLSIGSYTQVQHTYAALGTYNLTFKAPAIFGGGAVHSIACGAGEYGFDKQALKYIEIVTNPTGQTLTNDWWGFINCPRLEMVYYGDNVIYSYNFQTCSGLKFVSMNNNLYLTAKNFAYTGIIAIIDRDNTHNVRPCTTLAPTTFYYAVSLAQVPPIYDTTTGAGTTAQCQFQRCNALTNVEFVGTKVGSYTLNESLSLDKVVVGPACTAIYANAFRNCRMQEIHIQATTPPTLANSNAFVMANIASNKIYVPAASLTAYQAATNWDQFLIYLVGE